MRNYLALTESAAKLHATNIYNTVNAVIGC